MIVVHYRYRACKTCGEFKRICAGNFYREPRSGGWKPVCRACRRARARREYEQRKRDRVWLTQKREREARRARERRRTDTAYRERVNDAVARYRARLTKAQRLRNREVDHLRYRAYREAAGLPLLTVPADRWVGVGKRHLLDPAPVIAFVEAHENPCNAALGDPILERTLRRVYTGEWQSVDLGVVDTLCVKHGLLLHDLYPVEQYPEVYA